MSWREELFARRTLGIRLGLATISEVDAALGRPAGGLGMIHVVGTNGKGSTAAMVDHGLRGSGFRVGLYTSPHLHRVGERVRVDGEAVPDHDIRDAVAAVVRAEKTVSRTLSFFEVITLAALWVFAERGVELLVLEAGLGGRLDATRVRAPALTLVTRIAMDHQAYLGSTLPTIAAEKAAVITSGVPCLSALQRPEAGQVLENAARRVGTTLKWCEPTERIPHGLAGDYQRENAGVALAAVRHFCPTAKATALDGTRWPGRWEVVQSGPTQLIFDVAHNVDACRAVAAELGSVRPDLVVFGAMPDKDAKGMIEVIAPHVETGWLVAPPGGSTPGGEVAPPRWQRFGHIDDPAFLRKWRARLEQGGKVLVCGSHRLVGALRGRELGIEASPQSREPGDPRHPGRPQSAFLVGGGQSS